LYCVEASRQRTTEFIYRFRIVGIVKGLNELPLSSGSLLWLHTDFSFMTVNTLIEIMNLSFRRSKQTSASQEKFLAKEQFAREGNSSRAKATKHHYAVALLWTI